MPGQLTTLEEELTRIRNGGVSSVTRLLWNHERDFITGCARSICRRNSSILDIGCGRAGYLVSLVGEEGIQGYGIDPLLEVSLKPAKKNVDEQGLAVHLLCGAGEYIPFRDESFDTALALSTLQHVDNQDKVLLEIRRVLKPGGRLLVSVPQRRGIYSVRRLVAKTLQAVKSQEDLFTMDFSAVNLVKILNRNGFSVLIMYGRKFLPVMLPGFLSFLLKLHKENAVIKIIELLDMIADREYFLASNLIVLCAKEIDR